MVLSHVLLTLYPHKSHFPLELLHEIGRFNLIGHTTGKVGAGYRKLAVLFLAVSLLAVVSILYRYSESSLYGILYMGS